MAMYQHVSINNRLYNQHTHADTHMILSSFSSFSHFSVQLSTVIVDIGSSSCRAGFVYDNGEAGLCVFHQRILYDGHYLTDQTLAYLLVPVFGFGQETQCKGYFNSFQTYHGSLITC